MMNYQNMTNPNLPNPNLMNSYLSYSSITNNNRTPQEDEEEDVDDKLDISLDDIYNTNEVQNMKELIKCPICLNVLMSPVQCNKCNNCFCKLCINTYEDSKIKCPFRCEYPIYQENKFVKNVLSILKFKCKNGCSEIIKYEELEKHYEEDCKKIDFKKKYKDLLKRYKELKRQKDKTPPQMNTNNMPNNIPYGNMGYNMMPYNNMMPYHNMIANNSIISNNVNRHQGIAIIVDGEILDMDELL